MSGKNMLQRCWEHDYCAPCFYMITIVTEPRRPCLGELNAGTDDTEPAVSLSPIGKIVHDGWHRTSSCYPGVDACEHVIMPDHFHGILWVKERLGRPMGHIIKAFKRVCTQECRSKGLLLQPNQVPGAAPCSRSSSLWQQGFQDSILLRKGQLEAMANYIADNPRRLAAKLAHPELFTVVRDQTIAPGQSFPMIGNRELLQHPLKRRIQISRSISVQELASKKEELLYAAEHGVVLVSPCISPGEKEIARAVLELKKPLIVLLANGFSPGYKPPGRYFHACSEGRLLMIAPFPYQRRKQPITREQCLILNKWAKIVSTNHQNGDNHET